MNLKVGTKVLSSLFITAILIFTFLSIPTTSAQTVIFEDGFESGDFSLWTSTNNSPTVTSGDAHSGTYKAVFDAAGQSAQARFLATPVDQAFITAYVMFKSFPEVGTQTVILGLRNYTSSRIMADAWIKNDAGTVKWALRYYNNMGYHLAVSEYVYPELDTWYSVQVAVKSNSTTNAEARLYIDGSELTDISNTGLSNDLLTDSGYIWADTAITRWYDDVVIDTANIGPIPPPTVTTGAATGIATTQAILNGLVNANGDATTVTFEYGLTTGYGETVTATQSPVTGSSSTPVSAIISGLSPNTTYHFRVVGENAGGTTYGDDATFTTATTLLVTGPASIVYGSTGTITTSGGSGTGAMSYSAGGSTGCTVNASSGVITVIDALGSCSVTATKAADSTFAEQISEPHTVVLNKKPVTLSGTRNYDGSAAASYSILSVSNKVGSDVVTVVSGSATLASANVGARSITSTGTLTLGGAAAGNYTLTGATGSVTITALPVILTGTRTYDGSAVAAHNILTISNKVDADDVAVHTGNATLESANAGLRAIISMNTLTLGGTAVGNYTLTGGTGSVMINPLAVTLTGTRNYDGSTTASYSILSVSNKIGSDVVTVVSGSATLASANVGARSITSMGTLTLGGAAAGNYTLTGATGSVTISALPVNLNGTRTYDGTATASSSILSVSNKVGSDDVTVASGSGTLESADVGLRSIASFGTLTLGGTAASNYTLSGASGSVEITKADQAALIITGPVSLRVGSTGTITTSGGSGTGEMSYSADVSTGCSVDETTGEITVIDIYGTCVVTATKAADINYNAITSAEFTVRLDPYLIFLPFIGR